MVSVIASTLGISTARTATLEMAQVSTDLKRPVQYLGSSPMLRGPTMELMWHHWMMEDWEAGFLQETRQLQLSSIATQRDLSPREAACHLVGSSKRLVQCVTKGINRTNQVVSHHDLAWLWAPLGPTTLRDMGHSTPLLIKETTVAKAGIDHQKYMKGTFRVIEFE